VAGGVRLECDAGWTDRQAKTEAENRAREKAQKRLEHEQQRLKHRMELEAQAERARMQVRV
jgi:F0F1-type ATP synthase epsilon subunit